jgi:hypothetical protein
MKILTVKYAPLLNLQSEWTMILSAFNDVVSHPIDQSPWEDSFPYKPEVNFKIAYTDNSILMKYDVREKHIQGKYRQTNDPVHRDSCVEFFVSWDGQYYYNLEFNCMGTAHVGFGPPKDIGERQLLNRNLVESIRTKSTINPHGEASGTSSWELLLNIPFHVFAYDQLDELKGKSATGNFYKCGDDLSDPHFLSWNRIESESPNFHLPTYFGKIQFEG